MLGMWMGVPGAGTDMASEAENETNEKGAKQGGGLAKT